MRTYTLTGFLLGLILLVTLSACNQVVPEASTSAPPTQRPPKPTIERPTLTRPAAVLPTQTQGRPTKPVLPTFTAPAEAGDEVFASYDMSAMGMGELDYAFVTDHGYHVVMLLTGGVYLDAKEAGYAATFASPAEYLMGNAISTRASDDEIVIADYLVRESSDVELWEIGPSLTSQLVKKLSAPGLTIISQEFSPDGMLLALGYNNGEIRLYDTVSGALKVTIAAHKDTVTSMAFSPDGRYLISDSWSFDPFTYIFDTSSGLKIATLSTDSYEPGIVSFSPDGSLVAATDQLGTNIFATGSWAATGASLAGVWEGRFSCDSQLFMVQDGADTAFYSLESGEQVSTVEAAPLYCLYPDYLVSLEIDSTRSILSVIEHAP